MVGESPRYIPLKPSFFSIFPRLVMITLPDEIFQMISKRMSYSQKKDLLKTPLDLSKTSSTRSWSFWKTKNLQPCLDHIQWTDKSRSDYPSSSKSNKNRSDPEIKKTDKIIELTSGSSGTGVTDGTSDASGNNGFTHLSAKFKP